MASVEEARRQGHAISHGEVTPGTASISVPILDGTGLYALTVVGPSSRFFPAGAAEATRAAATRIADRLR